MASGRCTDEALLGLIEMAYTASEDPQHWEPFLLTLAESLRGTTAHLLHHDLAGAGSVFASVRNDPEALRLYGEHFHRIDPLAMSLVARRARPGFCATDERFVGRAELARSEFFNDFAVRFDQTRFITTFVERDDGSGLISALTLARGQHHAPFGPEETRWLRALSSHIRRALQIHSRIHRAVHESGVAVNAMDVLPCAVFLVDGESKVVLANRRGRALLESRDGLATDRGRLCTLAPAGTQALRHLCAAVAITRTAVPRSAGGVLTIDGRPSGRPPLQVLVAPAAARAPLGLIHPPVAALVFVSDPADAPAPDDRLLRAMYGLTPAECDVAVRIAGGRTLAEIAAGRGSAVETVRRQAKQILAKTGARHRGELVRLLLALPTVAPGS